MGIILNIIFLNHLYLEKLCTIKHNRYQQENDSPERIFFIIFFTIIFFSVFPPLRLLQSLFEVGKVYLWKRS